MKDITEFLDLVTRMRDAQKVYFITRNQRALIAAKSLEKQVDEQLILLKNAQDH
jgi:hypothetical protein